MLDRRTRRDLWRQRKNRAILREKGLLPPSGLTEGGRRIYTEADAAWRQQVAREAPYSRLCPPERPYHRHQRCSASRRPSENELSRCRPLGGQYLPHLAQQTYNAGRSRGRDRSCLQPSVLVEQHGIHLRMGVSRSIYLNDINEGSCGICCGRKCINPQRQNRQKKTPTSPLATWAFQLHHKWKNPLEPVPQMHL